MNLLETAASMGITGFLHCDELEKLAELAAGRDVIEVGSFKGLSAWGMAQTAKSVLCVDTFKAATDGQRQELDITTLGDFLRATAHCPNVHYVDMPSVEAAAIYDRPLADMIFLDATHTYDEVRADIEAWWPHLKIGGTLALHDYGHHAFPDVEGAARSLLGEPDWLVVTLAWWEKRG